MTNYNKTFIKLTLVCLVLTVSFFGFADNASAAFTCASSTMTKHEFLDAKSAGLIKAHFSISGNTASAGIRNYTYCSVPVSFLSYKVYDNSIYTQTYYSHVTGVVPPNSAIGLDVSTPSCMTQVDVYYGHGGASIPAATGDIIVNGEVFNQLSGHDLNEVSGNFCGSSPQPSTPRVHASCSANPSSVNVNGSVNWSANATGGNGNYTYSWTGTDGLSGSGSSVSKTYTNAGTKNATVTVTSGSRSDTANCSAIVVTPIPNLSATCSANPSSTTTGNPIVWTANVSGGTGNYTYSWTGTDSLSGNANAAAQTYSTAGTKNAIVTVTSGAQSVIANCSAVVTNPVLPNLVASCTGYPSTIQTNQSATFVANVSGGSGNYTYSWSGACSGAGSTCSNVFSYQGTQTANLVVTSGTQSTSTNCSVTVNQPTSSLSVSCWANPSSIQTGQSATFTANAMGGTGSYTYSWYGACTGSGSTCSNTYSSQGNQVASVTVTSGTQSVSSACSVSVTQNCTPNYQQRCIGTSLYWYDSCGNQGNYIGSCGGTTCTPNYQQRCIGNTLYWYDSCGNQGNYIGSCGVTNANLIVSKTVRNLTKGTGFANSTYASPSDTLMYMITLEVNGSQDAQNVVVRDSLPTNIIYKNEQVVARTSGAYNPYSGDIIYGLNLNTIPVGQKVTVTYQAQVAGAPYIPFGTSTLDNYTTTTSSNVSSIPMVNAPTIVTKAAVLGASTIATGITNNFWVDSFLLPLIIALIGVWMWRAGMFFGIEKWLDSKKKNRRGYMAEKELSARISQLQKAGK